MRRVYFILWPIGALVSAIAHLVAPVFMAEGTSWPLAHGWQREIAFFDLALGLYILAEVKLRGAENLGSLLLATACLSLFLGMNHLLSGLIGGWGYIHVAGFAANTIAVTVGFWLLACRKVTFSPTRGKSAE